MPKPIIFRNILEEELNSHLLFICSMASLNLQCPLCPAKFTIIARYLDHADEHNRGPLQDYLCPVCPPHQYSKRYRRRALDQHFRDSHREENGYGIQCKDCSQVVLVVNLKTHLKRHAQQSCKFTCPRPNCNEVFSSSNLKVKFSNVYLKHQREKHGNAAFLPCLTSHPEPDDFNVDLDLEEQDPGLPMDEDANFVVEGNGPEQFKKKFRSLWLQNHFCNLLPESQLNNIIRVIGDLVAQSSDHLLENLKSVLPDQSKTLDETFQKHDLIRNNFLDETVGTAYGRRKLADSVTDMLHPQVVTSFPELHSSKKSEIYQVSLAALIEQQLNRRQWVPERNGGFPPEFEYIRNLRYVNFV